MKEPSYNMGPVCSRHAPKPNPKYFQLPLKSLIGKYAKLAFKAGNRKEHMWVEITELAQDANHELRGILNNDPILALEWKCGDVLEFNRTEIEDICDG